MICAACGLARPADDLLAFWPVGRPSERSFVCRVTHPSPARLDSCFRAVVKSVRIHEIGPALQVGGPMGVQPVLLASESGCLLQVPA